MSRKTDLEEHVRESTNLIREFEQILRRSENPKERVRANHGIEEQRELARGYLEEYTTLCKHLGFSPPQDIAEIAVSFGIPLSGSAPKATSSETSQERRSLVKEDRAVSGPKAGIGQSGALHMAHALLIGVGNYIHPRFANLPATVRDVQAVAAVLTDPARCGYPSDNVRLLTSEQATAAGIRAALQGLAKQANSDTTAFIYFSGHGGRAREGEAWRAYLCPREANPDDLAHTAISGKEFSALVAAIPARKLLVILDACHAGGTAELKAADGTVVWKAGLPESYYEALTQGSGRVLLASSKEDQVSYVRGELSLFTHHLVQALNGRAAVRGDGLIHVLDVFHYVNESVTRDESRQVPILKVKDLDLNFPLALDRGGKRAGVVPVVPGTAAIREQIVRDPIAGAKALSEYLASRPEWAAKQTEVDLKRGELERIQHDLNLFGPAPAGQAAKNRVVFFLLQVCLTVEQGASS